MINEKLKKTIESQNLSNQDSLIRFIFLLPVAKQAELYDQIVENPDVLSFLSLNLEEKEKAFAGEGKEDWNKIFDNQEEFLNGLSE